MNRHLMPPVNPFKYWQKRGGSQRTRRSGASLQAVLHLSATVIGLEELPNGLAAAWQGGRKQNGMMAVHGF